MVSAVSPSDGVVERAEVKRLTNIWGIIGVFGFVKCGSFSLRFERSISTKDLSLGHLIYVNSDQKIHGEKTTTSRVGGRWYQETH